MFPIAVVYLGLISSFLGAISVIKPLAFLGIHVFSISNAIRVSGWRERSLWIR